MWASSSWNNQITLPFSRVSVVLFQIMKGFRDIWSDIIKTWLLCLSIMDALFETSSTEPANPAIGKDLSLMSQLWCVNNPLYRLHPFTQYIRTIYLDLSPGSTTQTLKMVYQQLFKTMPALFLFCYVVKTAFICPKSDWNNYMSGKKLQEFPIKVFDTMGLNSCYKECKAHGKCLSINFNRKLFVCELLSEKKSESKPLTDDQNSVYMEITDIVRSLLFILKICFLKTFVFGEFFFYSWYFMKWICLSAYSTFTACFHCYL